MELFMQDNREYFNKLNDLAEGLRKYLPIKQKPNIYDWKKVKEFFSKIWKIQFNVCIEKSDLKEKERFKNNTIGPHLLYNLIDIEGQKILQFAIKEPNDEDDLTVNLLDDYSSNYMEVLKILFFEFFGFLIHRGLDFNIPPQYIGDKAKCQFMIEMLIPNEELEVDYLRSNKDENGVTILNKKELVKKFNLNYDLIMAKIKLMHERNCF